MIDGHQLRVAEALSDIYTAERRLQAAKWGLDDRLADAHSAGQTQDELAGRLGLSQQAISNRLQRRRVRRAASESPPDGDGRPSGIRGPPLWLPVVA